MRIFWIILCLVNASFARANVGEICDDAAHFAARKTGVPVAVLRTITRTETGRARNKRLEPWPWTVNMEGTGKWFQTRQEALAYVSKHHARGARSYDIGCFQLNYRWHGKGFKNQKEMFDPKKNAIYAAEFIKSLYHEFGDWTTAAGAYHSRTPKYANKYKKRFARIIAKLDATYVPTKVAQSDPPKSSPKRPKKKRSVPQPLLSGVTGRLGSLVALPEDHKAQALF